MSRLRSLAIVVAALALSYLGSLVLLVFIGSFELPPWADATAKITTAAFWGAPLGVLIYHAVRDLMRGD